MTTIQAVIDMRKNQQVHHSTASNFNPVSSMHGNAINIGKIPSLGGAVSSGSARGSNRRISHQDTSLYSQFIDSKVAPLEAGKGIRSKHRRVVKSSKRSATTF